VVAGAPLVLAGPPVLSINIAPIYTGHIGISPTNIVPIYLAREDCQGQPEVTVA